MLLSVSWPELAIGGWGPLVVGVHCFLGSQATPSALSKCYHQGPIARKDQMDFFNVDTIVLGGPQRKGEGEMVPALGVRVCTSTDTEGLVPPIYSPLSRGAGKELQLH